MEEELIKVCVSLGMLEESRLLNSIDIDERWDKSLGEQFVADAVHEFNGYPEATLAWAVYLGMAVAHQWDKDWVRYKDADYKSYYGKAGFDDMDEHITRDILGLPLNSEKSRKLADHIQSVACQALTLMKHSGVEFLSAGAFSLLVDTLKTLYRVGASIELNDLGYKYVAI